MTRTFYRMLIEVEVLSEEPFEFGKLFDIHEQITTGSCSGLVRVVKRHRMSAKTAARALQRQGSDPEFFRLSSTGKDMEEQDA